MKRRSPLSDYSLYIIAKDDERFKLKIGDIVLGCPYQWDTQKTSIAFRLRDGYRPECNQYNSSLIPLTKEQSVRTRNLEWSIAAF